MPSHSVSCTFLAFIFFYIPTAIAGPPRMKLRHLWVFLMWGKENIAQYGVEYRGASRKGVL